MIENNFLITKNFLSQIFRDLHSHMGWSVFYEKYVIVEPIWYIKKEGNILIDCVCIDDLLFDFEKSFGEIVAKIIDEEASEFIEQALIQEKNYLLICDNPILFPYNRLEKFITYLKNNPISVREEEGIIHYHINEPRLSDNDIRALSIFSNEMNKLNKEEQLGIVISQKDPLKNFEFLYSAKTDLVDYLFMKSKKDDFIVAGKVFIRNSIKEANFIFE